MRLSNFLFHSHENSVQLLSHVQLFVTPWLQHGRLPHPSPAPGAWSNSCPSSWWCFPTVSSFAFLSPPAFSLSQHQGLFQWVSSSHQVAKYWSFSFKISPYNSGLISFRMDWVDLLTVHGTLKSLLQHHSSKASILSVLSFLIVQLSHTYMTTGKTITWLDGPLLAK